MAQIIKHRRGTATQLKTVLLQKGELGVSTGSVAGITTPVLHVGDGTNQAGFVVGRLFQGSTVPTLNNSDIGTSLNDMMFHDSATYRLMRLNSSGNENLDLTGNIANRAITGSLTVGTSASPNALLHVHGDISASGNIHAVGNITFEGGSNGTIQLGDAAGDNLVVGADISSSLIPNGSDAHDLGSTTQRWNDLFLQGSISASGGPHYIESTGSISLNSTAGTVIGATTTVVVSGSGGAKFGDDVATLDFNGSGAVSETGMTTISLTPSSTVDLDAGGAITIDGASVAIGGDSDTGAITLDSTAGISLDAGAASNFSTSGGALTLAGATGVTVTSTGGTLTLNGTGQTVDLNSAALDIDASGAITIDGSSTLSIDSADNTNITVGGSNKTLDIDASGALTIDSAASISIGTAADKPIDIDSTTLDIDASDAITIDSTSGISLDAGAASNLTTSAGAVTIDGADGINLEGNSSEIDITTTGALDLNSAAFTLNGTTIGIDGSSTVTIGGSVVDIDADGGVVAIDGSSGINIGTTTDTAIDIDSTTLDIDSTGAITIDAGNSSGISLDAAAASNFSTSAGGLTLEGAAGVTVTSTGGTLSLNGSGQTVDLNAATLDIDATNVNIDATSGISLDAAAASNFTTTDGVITINGKTGIAIQENGTDVIAIDTNQDVLFSRTGGSTTDPDVEVDGYTRFDGQVEVANTTGTTSTTTGALVVDGGVGIAENLQVGGNTTIEGNLTVVGTNTYVSSSIVDIGDSILTLNALNNAVDGGLLVIDVSGSSTGSNPNPTGSFLWNAADDYWYSGVSGSTYYRVPQQATNAELTDNRVLIADSNGRIEPSANITDNGTTVDFNDVDLTSIDKLEGVDGNTFIDIGTSDTISTKGDIVPSANNADDLGTNANRFKDAFLDGNLDVDGTLDVDGLSNLDAVDIDGNVQIDGTVTVGVNDTGYDVKFFGATSGQFLMWDESADELVLAGDSKLSFHDAAGGENIVASSDGHLEVNAGTTLDLTAPTIDLNASTELNIDGDTDLNGTLDVSGQADFQSRVDAQASLQVTGSITVSTGVNVEATGSGVGSRIAFRNDSDTAFGFLNPAMGSDVTSGLIGYNESKQLVVSNVIDGGSF